MRSAFLLTGLMLMFISNGTMAQQLRDPTRPPGGKALAKKSNVERSRPNKGMVLQTVLISSNRRQAVISGRLLSVGERIGEYRLVEIRDGEVVVTGSSGTRTLRLFPSVTKVEAGVTENAKGVE